MNEDPRTPDQREEDWAGRFQPMYIVRPEADPVQQAQQPVQPQPPAPGYPSIPKKRRLRWRRLIAIVLLLPLFSCATCLLVYVIIPPPPADVLILGVDARPGEGYVTRTDSIMLLGVQPRRMRVSLLSIPRDLFINVPGYGSQRINTVNVLGELEQAGTGPQLLSSGIANSFGIEPDYYARLNFDAFVQLVDAVGGLTIDVPKTIVDTQYPTRDYGTITVRFDSGRQRMDGETALIYARTRHADDDYGRAERQQQVLNALMRKLANPLHWGSAITVITLNVDTDMSVLEMLLYAPPVVIGGGTMDRLVIDRDYILPGGGGAVPDYNKLAPWLEPRFD